MIPLAFVVAIALATLVVMVVAAISLVRQARRMAESIARFRDELEPVLREIREDTERATERLERLQRSRGGPDGPGEEPPAARIIAVDPDGPEPHAPG